MIIVGLECVWLVVRLSDGSKHLVLSMPKIDVFCLKTSSSALRIYCSA